MGNGMYFFIYFSLDFLGLWTVLIMNMLQYCLTFCSWLLACYVLKVWMTENCAWWCMSFKSNGTGIALRMELEWMEYNATNVFMAAIFFSLTDFPQDIGKRSCCYWKKELPCNRYNGWKFSGFFPDYFQWGIRFITAILFVWGVFVFFDSSFLLHLNNHNSSIPVSNTAHPFLGHILI